RDADHRARLLRDATDDAPRARRHDRGAELGLHPHRPRQGPVAGKRHLQARPAQRGRPGGGACCCPARLPARRLHRHRNDLCARRVGLPRLPVDHAQGLSGDAGGPPAAVADLCAADTRFRPAQRIPRSQDEGGRMSDPVIDPVETVVPMAGAAAARMAGNPSVVTGLILVGAVVAIALLAPLLAPHDPYAQELMRRLVPPIWHDKGIWSNPLGTDNLGRDYLSRILYGARISLLIGLSVMVISGLIGTALGLAAGYFGGRTDLVISFFITARL